MATEKNSPSETKSLSKSDFIRQQPSTTSAVDVVANGKAVGLKFDASLVYKVRGRAKTSKSVVKKAATTKSATSKNMTTKSATSKKTAPVSKAEYVRAHPALSPKEIVQKAKSEGIKFGVSYVYNVRGAAKVAAAHAKQKKAASVPAKPTMRTNGVHAPLTLRAEDLLRAVAAEIGLGRAVEILAGERARVRAAMGA